MPLPIKGNPAAARSTVPRRARKGRRGRNAAREASAAASGVPSEERRKPPPDVFLPFPIGFTYPRPSQAQGASVPLAPRGGLGIFHFPWEASSFRTGTSHRGRSRVDSLQGKSPRGGPPLRRTVREGLLWLPSPNCTSTERSTAPTPTPPGACSASYETISISRGANTAAARG